MPNLQDIFDQNGFHVSHETMEKLSVYDQLLLKWQAKINLIGPTTIEERALRHFFDSAQLMKFIPDTNIRLVDFGSGAGFPGLVLAILGVSDVHLIESDMRKATFLREVSRETKTPVTIHDQRAETCKIEKINLFIARAFTALPNILKYMHQMCNGAPAPTGLFLKGAQYADELALAEKEWSFTHEIFDSATENEAKIIKIEGLNAI